MRAVVDDRELAGSTACDPDACRRCQLGLGSSLAALAGILIAPSSALNAVRPDAARRQRATPRPCSAGCASLPLTFVGAIILGEFESLLDWIDTQRIGGNTFANVASDLQVSAR